jgi:hypothetical protein
MSKRTRPRRGICAYCGETKPVTADHVPPKNLFRKPYPANLWTVPSCEDCNGGFSKDDEYFRLVLTLTEKAKGQPERDAVLPAAIRSLNNPRAEHFQESLLAKVFLRHRFSPGGLYLGQRQAIAFDGRRIDRMASRIIKGLFFKVKGHRFPDDHAIQIVPVGRLPTVAALDPEIDLTFRQFIGLVSEEPPREFGKSFAFRWLQSPNGPDHTMWLLYFYDHLEFFCTTHSLASVAGAGSLPTPTASKPGSDPR